MEGNTTTTTTDFSLTEMGSLQQPFPIHLLDVQVLEVDSSEGAAVVAGTIQFPSSNVRTNAENCGIKLRIEGKEKTVIEDLSKKRYAKLLAGSTHKGSYSRTQEHLLPPQEFTLTETLLDPQDGRSFIPFSISVPASLPQSIDKVEVRCNVGNVPVVGEMELSYSIQAIVGDHESVAVSKPRVFPFVPIVKKEYISSVFSIQVGQSVTVPNSWFFGLLELSPVETMSLKPSTSKVTLCPGQDLKIQLDYEGSDSSSERIDIRRIKVKFTERVFCKADRFEIKYAFQHWEKVPTPTSRNDTDEGIVQVPFFGSSTYNGKIIKVWHEMTVYVTKEVRRSKHSNPILGTTPIMPVSVVNVIV
eukprot:scaffold2366_cov115-Cylindrotheca_fusiformis.AAC.10